MQWILANVTPLAVLKWTGVVFIVLLEILFIIALILSMLNLI